MNTIVSVEKLVPDVYLESRDFKVFLKLLEIIKSTTQEDLNSWIKLYSPLDCNFKFLEYLAEFVGYKYDTSLSVAESRIIISNFVNLIKNRGSKLGFSRAISVLINARLASDPTNSEYLEAVNQLGFLEVYFDNESGITSLYFPKEIEYNYNILNYIRPIGTYIDLVKADIPEPESDIAINTVVETDINRNFKPYILKNVEGKVVDSDKTYRVNNALVNLSQIGKVKRINRTRYNVNTYKGEKTNE